MNEKPKMEIEVMLDLTNQEEKVGDQQQSWMKKLMDSQFYEFQWPIKLE